MFKQNNESNGGSNQADTTIGPSVKVEGDVNAVGNVYVLGSVNGTITTDQQVTVGENAEVMADIKSDSAVIAGKVKGKLSITKSLSLKATAHITGDIHTESIEIENGAKVNGQLTMGSSTSSYTSSSSESAE